MKKTNAYCRLLYAGLFSLSMVSSETVGGLLSKQLKENPHRETKKNEEYGRANVGRLLRP